MNGNDYQQLAMRTANTKLNPQAQMLNAALGLAGESGEFADLVKKINFQGHAPDAEHLKKELGDVLWYVALACEAMGFTMDDVMQTNIDKLKVRYPDGFKPQLSIVRKDGDL